MIRPPSEASSLIVQVTYGCSNNACDFCGSYLDKPFAVRSRRRGGRRHQLPGGRAQRVRRVFLADGDAVALSTRRLLAILELLRRELPSLERVSSMPTPRTCWPRLSRSCARCVTAGLQLLYLGLESGDDQTLAEIHKGVTVAEQIEGCRRAKEAGLSSRSPPSSAWPAPSARSRTRAATGEALSAIDPEYIGILTLMLTPGTTMHRKVADGEVVLPDSVGMLRELREIVAGLDCSDCVFRCNHASNYLPVGGRLPQDKAAILATLDKVLAAPAAVQLRPESWRLL